MDEEMLLNRATELARGFFIVAEETKALSCNDERCVCPQIVTLTAAMLVASTVRRNLLEGGMPFKLTNEDTIKAQGVMRTFVDQWIPIKAMEVCDSGVLDAYVVEGPVRAEKV